MAITNGDLKTTHVDGTSSSALFTVCHSKVGKTTKLFFKLCMPLAAYRASLPGDEYLFYLFLLLILHLCVPLSVGVDWKCLDEKRVCFCMLSVAQECTSGDMILVFVRCLIRLERVIE